MIKERIDNIKRFFKRMHLSWKYKRNKGSGKLLIQREKDRRIGLTTMMIKDCKKNDYYLYVPTQFSKNRLKRETNDEVKILCPLDNFNGRKNLNVVIDNNCSFEDVDRLFNNAYGRINIVNGFVYERLAR